MPAAVNSDAELVNATLGGDRDAFGRIVSRYQSLICSLAYSATGSLGQSEDLAQETFITAWKHLARLHERDKLRSWLCGIARNRINNFLRREGREPVREAEPLENAPESHAPEPLPVEYTISQEEESILWRSIERVPEIYREPLVLFYREHQSVEAVAEKLELTEDTVRQRLSRGRKLLHAQVISFVEGALERTNPGKAFTLGVLAALPLLATSAKAAAVGVTAAKGGAVAKATGLGALVQALIPIGAFVSLGGWLGYKMGGDAARSQPRRESVARFWTIIAGSLMLFVFLPLLLAVPLMLFFGSKENFLAGFRIWLDLMFVVIAGAFGFWLWKRRKPAREEIAVTPGKGTEVFIWSVVLATIMAGALFALAISDSNVKVRKGSGADAQRIINTQGASAQFYVLRSFYHSAWKQSDKYYDQLWIKYQENGQVVQYLTPADQSVLALLAEQGITCPTYVQGRDFDVFGWQGHLLVVLLLLIVGAGLAILLTISLKNKSKTPLMTTATKIGILTVVALAALIVTPLAWLNHHRANAVQPNRTAQRAASPTALAADQSAQAKQIATDFFEALGKADWNRLATLCPPGFSLVNKLNDQQKEGLAGVQLMSLGEPFTQAPYPGVYVPYEIRFKNGETKKFRLAVRQDNSEQRWYFDGGL